MGDTRVKICGLMRARDAEFADDAGADYVGVVLAEGFSRSLDLDVARRVLANVQRAEVVSVRVDDSYDRIMAEAEALGVGVVQLHGHEQPELASRIAAGGLRVWKAVRVRTVRDVTGAVGRFGDSVDGLLLDGWKPDAVGGTGTTFDWGDVASVREHIPSDVFLIAAGGLNPLNVREAAGVLFPDVVDVSSGVEARLGQKDEELIRSFLKAVR